MLKPKHTSGFVHLVVCCVLAVGVFLSSYYPVFATSAYIQELQKITAQISTQQATRQSLDVASADAMKSRQNELSLWQKMQTVIDTRMVEVRTQISTLQTQLPARQKELEMAQNELNGLLTQTGKISAAISGLKQQDAAVQQGTISKNQASVDELAAQKKAAVGPGGAIDAKYAEKIAAQCDPARDPTYYDTAKKQACEADITKAREAERTAQSQAFDSKIEAAQRAAQSSNQAASKALASDINAAVKAKKAEVDAQTGEVNRLAAEVKKCDTTSCDLTDLQTRRRTADAAKAKLDTLQKEHAALVEQQMQALAKREQDLQEQLAHQEATVKARFDADEKVLAAKSAYTKAAEICNSTFDSKKKKGWNSCSSFFGLFGDDAATCQQNAETEQKTCLFEAEKKQQDVLDERLKAIKTELGFDDKAAGAKADLSATQQARQQAVATQNTLSECPKQKFEVELAAPLVKPPARELGTADGKRVKYNDHCFVWYGSNKYGQWYQIVSSDTDGNGLILSYVREFYTYLAGAVGILSVLMIIVGGIQISAAGLDQSAMESGKNRIIAALAGMTLLFLSSLLLYTINPNFFQF